MKKTGLAVFFVLVILLGLLAGQLGIAHLPWSSEDTDTAPGPAVTEQAAEAPARDGEATAPATGTEDAGQEKAPAAPETATAADAETDQDAQPAVPLPEGAEIINGEAVVHGTVEKGDTVSKIIEGNTSSGSHPYVSAAGPSVPASPTPSWWTPLPASSSDSSTRSTPAAVWWWKGRKSPWPAWSPSNM